MRQDRSERGFTLLEIMVVVVIIAILAAIVVPTWISEARKGKYDPEVRAMFTEIAAKEEAYRADLGKGLYVGTASCPTAGPVPAGEDLTQDTCVTGDTNGWVLLRIQPTDSQIRCSYQVTIGCAGAATTNCPATDQFGTAITVAAPTPPFGTAPPATFVGPYYYILATCDMDASGGTNAEFLTESWDTSIQKQNYGK